MKRMDKHDSPTDLSRGGRRPEKNGAQRIFVATTRNEQVSPPAHRPPIRPPTEAFTRRPGSPAAAVRPGGGDTAGAELRLFRAARWQIQVHGGLRRDLGQLRKAPRESASSSRSRRPALGRVCAAVHAPRGQRETYVGTSRFQRQSGEEGPLPRHAAGAGLPPRRASASPSRSRSRALDSSATAFPATGRAQARQSRRPAARPVGPPGRRRRTGRRPKRQGRAATADVGNPRAPFVEAPRRKGLDPRHDRGRRPRTEVPAARPRRTSGRPANDHP